MSATTVMLLIVGSLLAVQVIVAVYVTADAKRYQWDDEPAGGWFAYAMTHGLWSTITNYRDWKHDEAIPLGYVRCRQCEQGIRPHLPACPHCGKRP